MNMTIEGVRSVRDAHRAAAAESAEELSKAAANLARSLQEGKPVIGQMSDVHVLTSILESQITKARAIGALIEEVVPVREVHHAGA